MTDATTETGRPVEAASGRAPGHGRARRALWTTLDQAMSSLANAALSIVLAREVSPQAFGTFALAFSVYTFLIGISQAVGGQLVVIRFTRADSLDRDRAVGLAAGNAVWLGVGGGLLLATGALLAGVPDPEIAVVVACALPVLLLQDAWRTALISAGTPFRAFVNDALWTGLQAGLVAVLLLRSEDAAWWFVAAWGASAAVAAVLGLIQVRQRPTLRGGPAWVRSQWDLAGNLLAHWVANLGSLQVAFVLLAAVGGVTAVGSVRAAQTLLGPLTLIGMAVAAFVVPELIRARPGPRGLARAAIVLSAAVLAVNVVWGGALLLLSDTAGSQLLGDTWDEARQVLPGMVVFACALAVTTGPATLFRVLDTTRFIVWTSALLGPMVLACSLAGQLTYGARGVGWGFGLAALLVVPVSVGFGIVVLRRQRSGPARSDEARSDEATR